MPTRKSSKNSYDYGQHGGQGYHNGGYATYGYGGPGYNEYKNNNMYGSYNPYGGAGYAGSIDRRSSREGQYPDPHGAPGPDRRGGVNDKWRNTYPYVPTSYNYHNNPRTPAESVDLGSEVVGEDEEEEREHWGSQWEFIFSCVGLSVGIGNVWRFPTLAYENGGGSFFIAYFILLIVIGKPMYYMELALGQFAQRGPVSVWKLCPLGVGIGIGQCVVSLIVAIYYNVVMSYCLYYIFASFASEVPWAKCSEDWFQGVGADFRCYERNSSTNVTCGAEDGICETSAEQFYRRAVLGVHLSELKEVQEVRDINGTMVEGLYTYALSQLGNIGMIKWDITLCLLLAWFVVFACLAKGIKSSGKVVYFTATFPYLILIALLCYGCTLPGAYDGIKAFFIPKKWTGKKSIADPEVWRKAAEQMFYSLSISWGGLVMFGSYNKFDHKVHITATAISSLDFATSIISGVVIFSILGQLKLEAGLDDIADVVKGGTGLAFIAYPDALSRLVVPQLWSVMFFFMLFLLGLDSEFALLETVLTVFYDSIPKSKNYKPILVFFICFACFLMSLPCVSNSGPFVFQIMDDYGGGMSVLWIAILEVIFIMWIYGVNNFSADIDFMLKIKTSIILKFLWVIIPLLLALILGLSLYSFEAPHAKSSLGPIYYPDYVAGIGYFLIVVVVAQVPLWGTVMACYYLCAPSKRIQDVVKPTKDWGPGDSKFMREYRATRPRAGRAGKPAGYDNQAGPGPSAGYYPGYQQSYHM
jgi:solute carrier family 6 amino acid transporter-like protein 5/7/9/14